jgi:hypothetical protein
MPRTRLGSATTKGTRVAAPSQYFDNRLRNTADPRPIGKEGIHLRAAAGRQCRLAVEWPGTDLVLRCHRGVKHQGCHLDVELDVWFDEYKDEWVIMPRAGQAATPERGRKSSPRKGV